ncbi:NAD-P-binding protein [Trametes cingulata]|nr:NAD-P-binding protein [Trametes cingulata]
MAVFYAVVGASRGIGLEFVRQLAARKDAVVFAVVRSKQNSTHLAAAVANLDNVHIIEGDVVDPKSISRAAEQIASISGGKLDYLIHNAARMDKNLYRGYNDFISAFLPLLRAGTTKKIVVISTGGAHTESINAAGISGMVAYGTTKAAAVMITTKWALQLKNEGFVVVSLAPGLVDTTGTRGESGDPDARARLLKAAEALHAAGSSLQVETPAESVSKQLKIIDNLSPSDSGRLLSHDGHPFF